MVDVDLIIRWESGDLDAREETELFAQLIKDGTAWTLQGTYGRTAMWFIEQGLIDEAGQVDWDIFDEMVGEPEYDWDAYNDDLKLGL